MRRAACATRFSRLGGFYSKDYTSDGIPMKLLDEIEENGGAMYSVAGGHRIEFPKKRWSANTERKPDWTKVREQLVKAGMIQGRA